MFNESEAPKEPAALYRNAAKELRQYYLALVAEGFTPAEALVIIGQSIAKGGQ